MTKPRRPKFEPMKSHRAAASSTMFLLLLCQTGYADSSQPAGHTKEQQIVLPVPPAESVTPTAPPAPPSSTSPDVATAIVGPPPPTMPTVQIPGELPGSPTDQSPVEFSIPSPIPLGYGYLVSGAIDSRYRNADTGRRNSVWINDAEIDVEHPLALHGASIGNIKTQLIVEDPTDTSGNTRQADVQLGEAYILYKLPFETETQSTVYLKAGQFQIPFGLLAVYDPHLTVVQPLYSQSLGLRTDWGLAVSGRFYGYLNYDFSLTAGTGPNRGWAKPNRVVSFRLGHTFVTRNGVAIVGGSMLAGRLPITDIDAANPFAVELPTTGYATPYRGAGYIDKTRIAADGTYLYKNVTGRGEAMLGADNSERVFGYYLEADYKYSKRAGLIAARSLWHYPLGNSYATRDAFGVDYAPDKNVTMRALWENLRDVPSNLAANVRHRVTVQALFLF